MILLFLSGETLLYIFPFVQNLVAEEFNYHRSRLSIMAQAYCDVTREMVLRSSVFTPEPKVLLITDKRIDTTGEAP